MTTVRPDTVQVLLLEDAAQFPAYKDAWQALERKTHQPCFFESYAWCGHTAEVLSRTSPGQYAPLVAVALRDGAPVAIWPLSRQRRSGVWQLRALDDPFGQFAGMLYSDADTAHALVTQTLDLVRQRRLADVLHIDRVLSGTPLEAALLGRGAQIRGEVGAPVIDTLQWPSIEALKSSRNKKTMKNLRNSMNRLSKAGHHEHRVETGGAGVNSIVAETLRLRSAWLDTRGLTAPQFRSAAHEPILFGGDAWQLDSLRAAFELRCGDKPIAYQWGFVHQNRYYAYMSATEPGAMLLSPGRLHLAFVVEEAMKLGVDGIEMLTPASDYKMVWTDTARRLVNLVLPLSAKGRVHDGVWEGAVRPALKALFYALPVGWRRRAVPMDAAGAGDQE